MSREDLVRRIAAFHDQHLAYESPETSPGAALLSKQLDAAQLDELASYVMCNVTIGDLRNWIARDGGQMRLGGAYHMPPTSP